MEENCCERIRDNVVYIVSWLGKVDLYKNSIYRKYYNVILIFYGIMDDWFNSIGNFFSIMILKLIYKIYLWEILEFEIVVNFISMYLYIFGVIIFWYLS